MVAACIVKQRRQSVQGFALFFKALSRRWDRHQTAQFEARKLVRQVQKRLEFPRLRTGFGALTRDIDLQADVERREVVRSLVVQASQKLVPINAVDPGEVLRYGTGFVRLQGADEMPDEIEVRTGLDFDQGLLQIVLAEVVQAARCGLANGLRALCFAHSEHGRWGRATVVFRRRGAYLFQHLCYIGGDCRFIHGAMVTELRAPPRNMRALRRENKGNRSGMDITELLAFSAKQGASDLHLSAGLPPMIRVDGDVRRINLPPMEHKQVHDLMYDIMNDKQRKDFEEFLETDFSFEVPGVARFRVNAFNQNRGAGGVFRTIPSKVMTMEDLGMGQVFRDISMMPRGLVLVTGPTGSGKSTTLAAMVDFINDNRYQHILTIEDPIEFVHESRKCLVNQREVHRDTLGFAEALRSALREDPDIILVGEMRDLETIRLALTAAETGHLVFGTLHTTSAAKTIDRVIDVFPAAEKDMVRSMLSESLQAVVSQTLLKRMTGGRVAAHEIMRATSAIRNLIREDKVAQMYSAIQTGHAMGMQTMDQCLKDLVAKRIVSKEAAREKARMPQEI